MNKQIKKEMVTQNISLSKYGMYKNLPHQKALKNSYTEKFNIELSTQIAEVYINQLHSLILAKAFSQNNLNPAIVMSVNREFDGSNIEGSLNINDDIINIRTTVSKTIDRSMFPIDNNIVLLNTVHVIRDESYQFIANSNDIFPVSIIVAAPLEPERSPLSIKDYIITKEIIESIFQTASMCGNQVLILDDFGCKLKGPIKDIIDIYNMMIVKYCHNFKYIVISIPTYDKTDIAIYTYFSKKIIMLQNLGEEKTDKEDVDDEKEK